ncbi:MAG: FtsX-like permease family protein [Thiobacillus sp.]|uniref:ABC transporter permease n=1 Tax=Thiobacillus sp. TaxID=924 RepID=UPI0028944646|nr:FtsX-like permease family protein [Thiobacillus sp.]MDT3707304.1 FtsX-like permease family protein [Thiobacillus sp.]
MTRLGGWLRVAITDLRGDVRRFAVLLACLALGVATIAIVGSVGAALQSALARDARVVLGGDLEARLSWRAASDDERALFASLGRLAEVVEVSGRARAAGGSAFVSLRAVDDNYPLLGRVGHDGAADLPALLAGSAGRFGAVADPLLADRLGLAPGDSFEIGAATFVLAARLDSLPDQVTQGFQLGVPVLISLDGLAATGILAPGVLARYRYKLLLTDPDFEAAAARIEAAFPEAGWQLSSPIDATEDLARAFDIFSRFLTIVGLSSLLVGGVGVANAVAAYITERQRSIATMRSLGATNARIMLHFLTQVMILVGAGVAIGLLLGVAVTLVALPVIGGLLSIALPPSVAPLPLLVAAAFGLAAGFAFAFLPLARATTIRPATLFRAAGAAVEGGLRWRDLRRPAIVGPPLLAALAMLALAAAITPRPQLIFWYAVGAIAAFAVLRLAASGLQRLLRLFPPAPGARLRHALKSIHRPGAPAPTVMLSLGLGLALLLLIALIDSNLRSQLRRDRPDAHFVFMDLFEDEAAALSTLPPRSRCGESCATPMLRAPIPRSTAAAASETLPENLPSSRKRDALTWSRLPAGSEITAGQWWPPDHAGTQLVSVFEELREPLGLKLGDTVTFTLFGEPLEATIANFRDFEWRGGAINFSFVLSPGPVEAFPMSQVGMLKAAPGQEDALQRLLVERFPDLIFVPVGDALAAVTAILSTLSNAVAIVGGLAVLSGVFVLAGALAAGRQQREADATVMKVLGATRSDVVIAYLIEYGLLGALSAALAALLGGIGAWAFVTRVLEIGFRLDAGLVLVVAVTAVGLTILTGMLTTWSALSVRPVQFLRGE